MPKNTVIYHRADFDGIFCREIAKKFLDAELIGWDFTDKPLTIPEGQIYILDLPVDRVFGFDFGNNGTVLSVLGNLKEKIEILDRVIWIDHHKSSIESHPTDISGYRIDGVAACRLVWQWFTHQHTLEPYPDKQAFVDRRVTEPLAVRLAGEYDIWDKRDPRADVFQFGLRSVELTSEMWNDLLTPAGIGQNQTVEFLLNNGGLLQRYQQSNDARVMHRSFLVEFEGLKFLALNTAWCNSLTFASKDVPETGHDALMGFFYNGSKWTVSLYHAKHRTDLDLSAIAVFYGGGGHRGACGFTTLDLSNMTR